MGYCLTSILSHIVLRLSRLVAFYKRVDIFVSILIDPFWQNNGLILKLEMPEDSRNSNSFTNSVKLWIAIGIFDLEFKRFIEVGIKIAIWKPWLRDYLLCVGPYMGPRDNLPVRGYTLLSQLWAQWCISGPVLRHPWLPVPHL